ncbi:hypothetical protein EJ06DRAFT_515702 [Trichodelitschia bisporula]|uniref:Zn(2)-C6 fungal-type domain-containing protein n=1 Tax=Trichodelitschia bisporula TaxID=703511 RepID=A0A6G1HLU9_9PEZI|nr:hypothetical protein EJ06DRAFT_515702 [Trichodelitschia bisporula]
MPGQTSLMPSGDEGPSQQASGDKKGDLKSHTRTYQACNRCRLRKVKCDLGPVDDPHPPPCARCRREGKDCAFEATRRKRKSRSGSDDEAYVARNGRKRTHTSGGDSSDDEPTGYSSPVKSDSNCGTPTNSRAQPAYQASGSQAQPAFRTPAPPQSAYGMSQTFAHHGPAYTTPPQGFNGPASGFNALTSASQVQVISGPGSASLQSSPRVANGTGITVSPPVNGASVTVPTRSGGLPSVQTHVNASERAVSTLQHGEMYSGPYSMTTLVDAAMLELETRADDDHTASQVLKAWQRLQFVRSGWITPTEGHEYISFFSENIQPLTPIALPNFSNPACEMQLLEVDQTLLVTLLLIASRHRSPDLKCTASRQSAIHDMLWKHLEGRLMRSMLAQEQWGGGFCGAGPGKPDEFAQPGLRSLGTIESLLLLMEWHPRALHFPPKDTEEDLLLPEKFVYKAESQRKSGPSACGSWLEPCWRSDRVCWTLLNYAMTLAVELGVFEDATVDTYQKQYPGVPAEDIKALLNRKLRIKSVLWTFHAQTVGRLELTSKLPFHARTIYVSAVDTKVAYNLAKHVPPERGTMKWLEQNPKVSLDMLRGRDPFVYVQYFWEGIAAIMKKGNEDMFLNNDHTRNIIEKGEYAEFLRAYVPVLDEWREEFDRCSYIPKQMRYILEIEYGYCRAYLHSLALQAIVLRCVKESSGDEKNQGQNPRPSIQPNILFRCLGDDRQHVVEVVTWCRKVLEVVTQDLLPTRLLKSCPVRTYFRIICVAIILLKTFALGAAAADVHFSIKLLQDAITALEECIVDDVHIGQRFASTCDLLIRRVREKVVTVSINPPATNGTSEPDAGQWNGDENQPGVNQGAENDVSYDVNDPNAANFDPDVPMSFDFMQSGHPVIMPPSVEGLAFMYGGESPLVHGFPATWPQEGKWVGLPLDPLLNRGVDVGTTSYGPDVGGQDMLDILLGYQVD